MESTHVHQPVDAERAPLARAGWSLLEQMRHNAVQVVAEDAETEREYLEGLRTVARISSLCAQISVEADPEQPRFFDMCSPTRMVGGPNPDGNYHLAMIRGDRRYRISGSRGTTTYLGFQILAGTGLTPRRMAAYVSDAGLEMRDGAFALVLAADEPSSEVLGDARWVQIPPDASSIVVREYIADRAGERTSSLRIEVLDAAPISSISDAELGEQLTAMAWTMLKLITLHRTIKPELLTTPNVLLTAEAADLGAADTTPDNLYMIGTYRLEPDQALVLEFEPPDTRYWNVALETIWHEVPEPDRCNVSVTNRGVRVGEDGMVRIMISARDFGHGHWLDTGGRHRGFVLLRWLDNPAAPDVQVSVRTGGNLK